jgi:alkylation response protein AidB-like acyl-CoA dehydrogenase
MTTGTPELNTTFELTDDQRMLRDAVREFCEREVAPHVHTWDEREEMPIEVIHRLADLGLWGMTIPEVYGGAAVSFTDYMVVVEELARWSASVAIVIAVHNSIGAGPILVYGNEEQKKRFLPEFTSKKLACFCLTEPSAGSDAGALQSTAKRDGDSYVLNGTKIYITSGDIADVFIVFAKTDPAAGNRGITAFIVPKGTPGLRLGTREKKMGLRASGTMEIILEDARVPVANRLGEEGQGFRVAMSALDGGRIGVGAQACGVARAAYLEAVSYAKTREAFGQKIAEFQGIRWKLADMAMDLDAAWLLVLRAAALKDAGRPVTKEAAMAKLFASEMVQRVTNEAVQIHGGYGYIREYAVERYYRDARVMALYEGTSEIQRHVIARELLR